MQNYGSNVAVEQIGDVSVLSIQNNLDRHTAESVRTAYNQIGNGKVVINLGQVTLTSSRGIATIVSVMLEGEQKQQKFCLCEISDPCMLIIKTMNIMAHIEGVEIFGSLQEAIEFFNES